MPVKLLSLVFFIDTTKEMGTIASVAASDKVA